MVKKYDVIVIGAGHAGCEAALISSRMGAKTLLVTIAVDNIGLMSCNPAIGGLGKGNLVRDIDALGGEMARNIDASGIQYKVLNRKKGSAVHSSRAQADKYLYKDVMIATIMSAASLDVKQGIVVDIVAENQAVKGVRLSCGQEFACEKLVICGGTFIGGEIYIGSSVMKAGRMYEPSATALSSSLKSLGFSPIRLKTDTPARVHIDSIDTHLLEAIESDEEIVPFSAETQNITLPQIKCYKAYTNEKVHEIIRANLHRSLFYNGSIDGMGPRYCPSIEDKVTKFTDKAQHPLIIEPEGLTTKEVHINGFSTSMPVDAQLAAYRAVHGLARCEFTRPAYAIQYDVFQPTGLYPSYETKLIKGIYMAGQLNGTSGYEEAAAQGLLAGINAVLSLDKKEPFILGRHESYLGILTDDLVTKGVEEPYRMFSSRSEFRLLTREDNSEERLIEYGYKFGTISKTRYERFKNDMQTIDTEIARLKSTLVKDSDENRNILSELGTSITQSVSAHDLLRRPELSYKDVCKLIGGELPNNLGAKLEAKLKYSGYIEKQLNDVEKYKMLESVKIPDDFDYSNISGLRKEYSERLSEIRPKTLGQALRIPGLSVNAISVIDIEIKKREIKK